MEMSAVGLHRNMTPMLVRNKLTKVRVCENGLSYEDFSVSYTLAGYVIFNFNISEEGDFIILKKKDKRSTKHIKFDKNTPIELTVSEHKKAHLILNVIGEVRYTDGTHRYKKDKV